MSKKLTSKEFSERLLQRNKHIYAGDITLMSEYNGLSKHITYRCNRCNTIHTTIAATLYNGSGCPNCSRITAREKQRKSDTHFQLELADLRKSGHDIYCDDNYINSTTKLTFYCSKKHIWQAAPHKILLGQGCPICAGKQVLVGFNDIATTAPSLALLLNNSSDAYKYTKSSQHEVEFKCPDCGYILKRSISLVNMRGLHCPRCSSGVSYPNRLGRIIFEQLLGPNFITEYRSDWTKGYIYDIYFSLNDKCYVVEFDGAQHYDNQKHFCNTCTSQYEIDSIKNKIAADNNIHLIRIDCSKSDLSYIRSSIENSALNDLFDLSEINWHICNLMIQTSIVKTTCALWASGLYSVIDIAKQLHIGCETARLYIKRGAELGWCPDNIKSKYPGNSKAIRITKLDTNDTFDYPCAKECKLDLLTKYNFDASLSTILKYARLNADFKGFHFELIKEFK